MARTAQVFRSENIIDQVAREKIKSFESTSQDASNALLSSSY